MKSKRTLLIVGAAGSLAQAIAPKLAAVYDLVGTDTLPVDDFPGTFYQLNYSKRPFASIFQEHSIWGIAHLGRVSSAAQVAGYFRYKQNVLGMKSVLNVGLEHGVKRFLILSTHLVYGAFRENHLYIREDEPLKANANIPELSDAVTMDLEANEFMWKHREVQTTILRPTHVVGKGLRSPMVSALQGPLTPVLLGFDPLMQFIHKDDLANAILKVLANPHRGVFNIAGEGVLPFSTAAGITGSRPVPVVSPMFPLLFRLGRYRMPRHYLDLLRFPIVIKDDSFRQTFDWTPKRNVTDTLRHLNDD